MKRRRRVKDRRANDDYSSSSDNRDRNFRKNARNPNNNNNPHAGAAAGILATLAQYLPSQNIGSLGGGFPFMGAGRQQVLPTIFPPGASVQPAQIQQAAAALAALRLRSAASGFPFYMPQLFPGTHALQPAPLLPNQQL
jgi:hypothetical protein